MKQILTLLCALALTKAANARMVTPSSLNEYNQYYKSTTPLVTMYTGSNCGACKQMKPHFEALAHATPDISFCIIDVNAKEFSTLTSHMRSIPVAVFSRQGQDIRREVGSMSRHQLDEAVKGLRTTCQRKATAPAAQKKR